MEDKMIIIRLCECTDPNVLYGALKVPYDKIEEIQNAIYHIKQRFYDENDEWYNMEWQIENLLEKLQKQFPEIEQVNFAINDCLEC